ncbi:MAG TPA: lactoylglutathione lyase [Gammaproteobacteria bacterium]|nr:lactoylglutathione lyase [Gammaproteobacteria bacterium]MEC8012520.1 lactoylglutathione lyase [Pseudomonadota bacterium]HBF09712.1 lactoylglutathione lyase [Gammaproteobacteria bacterium]HCK91560.1 lactoylglutathione lyase [Gammaproteobacteria bacterium]|tara:strand:- start:26768 stop:27169 length:402 start_codon:yes stop_codon:yes gene_type:complete
MKKILHTMIRVNNLQESIDFYTKALGMNLINKFDNTEYKYTLAFLGYGDSADTTIELTYNWDTDSYDHGNAFGHIAIGTDDINAAAEQIKTHGGTITREPGPVKGGSTVIAFAKDPSGYSIELIESDKSGAEF